MPASTLVRRGGSAKLCSPRDAILMGVSLPLRGASAIAVSGRLPRPFARSLQRELRGSSGQSADLAIEALALRFGRPSKAAMEVAAKQVDTYLSRSEARRGRA
jgi:hypothetical protein